MKQTNTWKSAVRLGLCLSLASLLFFSSGEPGGADGPDPHALSLTFKVQKPDGSNLGKLLLKRRDGEPLGFMEQAAAKTKEFRAVPDLGDPMEWSLTFLPTRKDFAPSVRVEQQIETSLTIMDEGPHLDLNSWKHGISPWTILKPEADLSFRSLQANRDQAPFPNYEIEELENAVQTILDEWNQDGYELDKRWLELAAQCKSGSDYPCGIGISQIRFRLLVQLEGQWQELYRIVLDIPMGC